MIYNLRVPLMKKKVENHCSRPLDYVFIISHFQILDHVSCVHFDTCKIMYMIHQLICSYSYWESRVYLLHSHTTTFSKSGGATCFTPVTDWGMLSIISHPHDEMSMVGGLSFRAAFQISTCKWHLNKCWINASSVGGRIFMLGVGFAANEILMAKKFHGP